VRPRVVDVGYFWWMTRHGNIVAGGIILGVGLLITLGTMAAASSSGGGHYVVATGAIVVGLVRIVRGMAMRDDVDPDKRIQASPDDPRWGGGTAGRQLVGRSCVACKQKVSVEGEGRWCKACNDACHKACFKEHKRTAHRPASGVPYR